MTSILMLCAIAVINVGQPSVYTDNEELNNYLVEAAENSPALQMRHTQYLAALEKIPQVTSLDDPMFTYGYFLQSATGRYKVGLMQKFPWFGTFQAKGDKATADADVSLAQFFAEKEKLFAKVKQVYFEYAFLDESTKVAMAQDEILEYMEEIVRSKYSLGLAHESAMLRVQIASEKLKEKLDTLNNSRPALSAMFSEMLGREDADLIPWPQNAWTPSEVPPLSHVKSRIQEFNPELKAIERMIESSEKMKEVARKKGFPNFSFGLEYVSLGNPELNRPQRPYPSSLAAANRFGSALANGTPLNPTMSLIDTYSLAAAGEPMAYPDDMRDNFMVSVRVNVPIWRKRVKAGIKEAELKKRVAELDLQRKTLNLNAIAVGIVKKIEDTKRRDALYNDSLIPKAEQTYESLQDSYTTGVKVDFQDLLDSINTLLTFKLEQLQVVCDLQIYVSQLEMIMGESLAISDTENNKE